jgi:hypothetical protein
MMSSSCLRGFVVYCIGCGVRKFKKKMGSQAILTDSSLESRSVISIEASN